VTATKKKSTSSMPDNNNAPPPPRKLASSSLATSPDDAVDTTNELSSDTAAISKSRHGKHHNPSSSASSSARKSDLGGAPHGKKHGHAPHAHPANHNNNNNTLFFKLGNSKCKFRNADAATFSVRCGPDYAKNGNKAASLDSLYDLISVDLIKSNSGKVSNPGQMFDIPTHMVDEARALRIPPVFVCNFQLPSKANVFSSAGADNGNSLVLFFCLKPNPSKTLPAVKLLQRFHENKLHGRV